MRWRRPAEVAAVDEAGTVYLANVFAGPIVVLEGPAATIWRQAVAGDGATTAARVASVTGVELEVVAPQVEEFVRDLVGRGLLEAVS